MSSGCCPLIPAGRSWTRSQAVAIKNIASIFGITAEEPANSRTQPMRLFFKGKLGVRSWRKADEAPKRAGSPGHDGPDCRGKWRAIRSSSRLQQPTRLNADWCRRLPERQGPAWRADGLGHETTQ
jgi:hypothetical protein